MRIGVRRGGRGVRLTLSPRGVDVMLFGLSLSKALVIFTVAFLLFGVPLMTFVIILLDRRKRDSKNG